MNIYRGCTHGCVYCDSRSRCYQFTHLFEDIEVKRNAPELLEKALQSKRKKCMIGTGSMSDPYMHCEEELRLTRRCLEIIQKYGSKDVAKNRIWLGGNESTQRPEIIDSTGFHHEWHDDCRVAKVCDDQMTFIYDTYLLFEAANEAMPFTVNVFCPDENKQPTADQIANGEQGNLSIIASAKLSYKVNAAEQVFTSANGEVFRVSDFYFYTNHEDKNNLSNLLFDMKFNFANSTQRSFVEQELTVFSWLSR